MGTRADGRRIRRRYPKRPVRNPSRTPKGTPADLGARGQTDFMPSLKAAGFQVIAPPSPAGGGPGERGQRHLPQRGRRQAGVHQPQGQTLIHCLEV